MIATQHGPSRTATATATAIGVVLGVIVAVLTTDVILGVIAGASFIAIAAGLLRIWTGGGGEQRSHHS